MDPAIHKCSGLHTRMLERLYLQYLKVLFVFKVSVKPIDLQSLAKLASP